MKFFTINNSLYSLENLKTVKCHVIKADRYDSYDEDKGFIEIIYFNNEKASLIFLL